MVLYYQIRYLEYLEVLSLQLRRLHLYRPSVPAGQSDRSVRLGLSDPFCPDDLSTPSDRAGRQCPNDLYGLPDLLDRLDPSCRMVLLGRLDLSCLSFR